MIGIQQAMSDGIAQTQSGGESNLGNPLGAHRRVQGQFGGGKGRYRDHLLTLFGSAWRRNILALAHVSAKRGKQGIPGHLQGFGAVFSAG